MMNNGIGEDVGAFIAESKALFKKYGFVKKKVRIVNGKKKHVGDAVFIGKHDEYCVKNLREILEDIYGEIGI